MENHGLIIRHLRRLAGLNVQQTAKKNQSEHRLAKRRRK